MMIFHDVPSGYCVCVYVDGYMTSCVHAVPWLFLAFSFLGDYFGILLDAKVTGFPFQHS